MMTVEGFISWDEVLDPDTITTFQYGTVVDREMHAQTD